MGGRWEEHSVASRSRALLHVGRQCFYLTHARSSKSLYLHGAQQYSFVEIEETDGLVVAGSEDGVLCGVHAHGVHISDVPCEDGLLAKSEEIRELELVYSHAMSAITGNTCNYTGCEKISRQLIVHIVSQFVQSH